MQPDPAAIRMQPDPTAMQVELIVWARKGLSGDMEYSSQATLVEPHEHADRTIQMGYSQGSASEYLAAREALRDLYGRVSEEMRGCLANAVADPVQAITERRSLPDP